MEVLSPPNALSRLGPYLLGPCVAKGGMGEVFLAARERESGDVPQGTAVALKLLLPHLVEDASAVAMFINEARIVARLNHPNVVRVLDVGLDQGRYFIAMELVRGVSLSQLGGKLRELGRALSPQVIAWVGRELCAGLHHAHEQRDEGGHPLNLIHRDVTPHNVLVSDTGDVKLTDFGIAKFRESTVSQTGSIKGKLEYLSPEQIQGGRADVLSDVYSAAVTLFYSATNQSPYRRPNEGATVQAIQAEPLPSLAGLRDDLAPELIRAIERGADKVPRQRFPTAWAFREALPEPSPQARRELAALVRELHEEHLRRLAQPMAAARRDGHTQSLWLAPRAPSRWSAFRRGGVGLVAGGAALLLALLLARHKASSHLEHAALPPTVTAGAVRSEPSQVAGEGRRAQPQPEPRAPLAPVSAAAQATKPKRPAQRALERLGRLTVDASPWADVVIAGVPTGQTPVADYPVKAGWIVVVLSNPETGKRVTRRVRVPPGESRSLREDLR